MNSVQKGRYGEYLAIKYLKERFYKIIWHHWTGHWAEIDIVALRNNMLIFVEVKYIESTLFPPRITPQEQYTRRKRANLMRSISLFFSYEKSFRRFKDSDLWQVDLICITKTKGNTKLTHYKNVNI